MGNSQQDFNKCNLVKVEFLTRSQKEKKDFALKKWEKEQKELEDSEEFNIMKSETELYKVDFRQDVYIPKTIEKIDVGYITKFFHKLDENVNQSEDLSYPELTKFFKIYVKSFILMINGKEISDETYSINMSQCLISNPVFEFIYEKAPFLEKIANQLKFACKQIKRSLIKKVVGFFGLSSLLDTYNSLKKGEKAGSLTSISTIKLVRLIGYQLLKPRSLMMVTSYIFKQVFPFARPLLYIFSFVSN